ncbi:hypothetical protein [Thalassobacterium maritimum]|nr:hypothetical protein [Coraliomargarita sp. SDUM461003]
MKLDDWGRMRESFRNVFIALLWLVLVIWGISALWVYSQRAGGFSSVPDFWPEHSSLPAAEGVQLLMFVHPRCPCSRASLGELAVLMRNCQQGLSARVLFISPKGQSMEWVHSSLWAQAKRIPNVSVELDVNAMEARRFGAEVSGATLVYGAQGELLFHGGITASRGHYGDNMGRLAIQQLSMGRETVSETAVFGCPLNDVLCGGGEFTTTSQM